MQLKLVFDTAVEQPEPAYILRDVSCGSVVRSVKAGALLMKVKPTGFILNSTVVGDILNRGDCLVVNLSKGTLYGAKSTTEIEYIDSTLTYRIVKP